MVVSIPPSTRTILLTFHSLWNDPGGAVAKEELLALGLSPDYRHECGICDRDYMLRRGCPCCRD
mgnify:CR=1 FL=1